MSASRETGFRPRVVASLACILAWLMVILTAGFEVTGTDGKVFLSMMLIGISLTGVGMGLLAWAHQDPHAAPALAANAVVVLFSITSTVAVLS